MSISSESKPDKILELVKQSWQEFKIDYKNKKIKYYSNEKNPEGFLVCWKEDDIVLQLSNYFYKNLHNSALKDDGIEFHSQTEISALKFGEYAFNKNGSLSKLKDRLPRTPKPDFVITKEDDTQTLWLIGEVKYFREWRPLYKDKATKKDRVDKDLDELFELKNLDICKKTAYLLADSHFHENNRKKWDEVQERLHTKKQSRKIDYLDLVIMCDKKKCKQNDFTFEGN